MVSGVVQEFALTNVCKMEVQCGFWIGRDVLIKSML